MTHSTYNPQTNPLKKHKVLPYDGLIKQAKHTFMHTILNTILHPLPWVKNATEDPNDFFLPLPRPRTETYKKSTY